MEIINITWKFLGNNASEVIAFSALALAIWQGFLSRRHNKLSVRPHLSFSSKFTYEKPHVLVTVKNDGLGTAIVKDYCVYLDGVKVKNDKKSYVMDASRELNFPGRYSTGGRYFEPDDSISTGQDLIILKIELKEDVVLDHKLAHEELTRIQFKIKYESLYGSSYEASFNGI